MKTNDRGIAVPSNGSPLPWKPWPRRIPSGIVGANGRFIDTEPDTFRFQTVAANYHERMAEIVRRLEAWSGAQDTPEDGLWDIINDATTLWAEYQDAVK
jgi:hypothetical protein